LAEKHIAFPHDYSIRYNKNVLFTAYMNQRAIELLDLLIHCR